MYTTAKTLHNQKSHTHQRGSRLSNSLIPSASCSSSGASLLGSLLMIFASVVAGCDLVILERQRAHRGAKSPFMQAGPQECACEHAEEKAKRNDPVNPYSADL